MTANCRGDHTRTSWAPAVKAILRLYRTRRARAKGLQGRPRGQPGKAVGHAVGKLTLRDDLAEVWVKATARSLAPRRDTTSVEPLTARGVSDRVFSTSVAPM